MPGSPNSDPGLVQHPDRLAHRHGRGIEERVILNSIHQPTPHRILEDVADEWEIGLVVAENVVVETWLPQRLIVVLAERVSGSLLGKTGEAAQVALVDRALDQ